MMDLAFSLVGLALGYSTAGAFKERDDTLLMITTAVGSIAFVGICISRMYA